MTSINFYGKDFPALKTAIFSVASSGKIMLGYQIDFNWLGFNHLIELFNGKVFKMVLIPIEQIYRIAV